LYKSNPAKATLLPGRASFMLQIRTALRARVGSDSRHRQCRSQNTGKDSANPLVSIPTALFSGGLPYSFLKDLIASKKT